MTFVVGTKDEILKKYGWFLQYGIKMTLKDRIEEILDEVPEELMANKSLKALVERKHIRRDGRR